MATPSKYTTGFADGMFSAGWMQGGVQGAWIQEPHTRYSLEGGISNEPTALFGGVAIKTTMGAKGRMELGAGVTKAAAVADVQGFVIDSKMYHAVVTAQNTAPQVGLHDGVHFARIGSRVRMYLGIDPTFAETLYGAPNTPVSFDFTKQQIIASTGATDVIPVTVTEVFEDGITLVYNAANDTVTYGRGPVAVVRL
ncbi:hypothetical protein [Burkholderia ubonensis]|uniref:hypothetical protein n=1 Tax=Burkholderia ubonensis TaxID=101571 RepID=UPI000A5A75A9|nr:hypothetical protein [Burkholderia ubonensis]